MSSEKYKVKNPEMISDLCAVGNDAIIVWTLEDGSMHIIVSNVAEASQMYNDWRSGEGIYDPIHMSVYALILSD